MAGLDLNLLATYLRNKIGDEQLSLRKAADQTQCSAATLSRLLHGEESGYAPDTATLNAVVDWLGMTLADFEEGKRPSGSTLAEVEVHLHALPDISQQDAEAMMAVVRALYEAKRQQSEQHK